MIRQAHPSDASDICTIYNKYVEDARITFEEKIVTEDDMHARIINITRHYPWLVYEDDGKVIGYTYANKWKERSAYRYAVETGIYLAPIHTGKGIGTKLKGTLIEKLKEQSIHCIISGIALPNPASIALCEKFGFEKIAHFKEVGFKMDKWIDVGYWQLILKNK